MKKSKKKYHIKRVNECLGTDLLSDGEVEQICRATDYCIPEDSNIKVEIIDMEELKSKLHGLHMDQQHSINNRNFFETEIEIRKNEISRLIAKIERLEEGF